MAHPKRIGWRRPSSAILLLTIQSHFKGQLAELQAQFDEKDVELRSARAKLEEERAQFALQQEQQSKSVEVCPKLSRPPLLMLLYQLTDPIRPASEGVRGELGSVEAGEWHASNWAVAAAYWDVGALGPVIVSGSRPIYPWFYSEMARPGINEQQLHEILNWVNEEKATREEMEVGFSDQPAIRFATNFDV